MGSVVDLVSDTAGIGGDGGVDFGAVDTLEDFDVAPETDIFGIADIAPDFKSILLMIEGIAAASDGVLRVLRFPAGRRPGRAGQQSAGSP